MKTRAAGFTLIEMAVALALAGLVGLILLDGLRMTVSGYQAVSRHADRLDARFSLDALLTRALATAAAAPVIGGEPGFAGQPEHLSFVAVADDGGPGLYRVELGLAGKELVLTRRFAIPFAEPRRQRSVVAWNLRAFRLAYFGAAGPADPPAWHDRWQGLNRPPQLVRISLEGADGEARPPLVIRLWGAG